MCFVAIAICAIAVLALAYALLNARIRLVEHEAQKKGLDELNRAKASEILAQRESLRSEFAKLASDLLGDKQTALSKANEESVRMLFSGLKEKLDRYEREVEKSAESNVKMEAEMKAHVDSLQKFATEARAFTSALVGGNKIQGNKGEEILASVLEQSGLQKSIHYDVQTGDRDEGRPDVSIYDIRNHHVILVDSKMNIKDYISAYNLPDDAAHKDEKSRALRAHVASIKRQVDSLSSKDYANKVTPKEGYTNLPLVAMFCPFDTVLEAALAVDPALVQYAYEKNIVFVTPLTLWGYLWLVSWGWKQHEVERRYDEIQELGRDVITAVDSMLNDIASVGDAIDKAKAAYESLQKRATADKGQMSVHRVATKLLDYGVTPKGRLKQLGKTEI
jgi:DNA recombination protein RmuC